MLENAVFYHFLWDTLFYSKTLTQKRPEMGKWGLGYACIKDFRQSILIESHIDAENAVKCC